MMGIDTVPFVYEVNVAAENRPSSAQFMVSPGNGLSTTDPLTSMTAGGDAGSCTVPSDRRSPLLVAEVTDRRAGPSGRSLGHS
jgi:hypothetical protein